MLSRSLRWGRRLALVVFLLCCKTPSGFRPRSEVQPRHGSNRVSGGKGGVTPCRAGGARPLSQLRRDGAPPLWPENRRSGGRVQLHRALSKLGLCSRSVAQTVIKAGRVSVNGQPVSNSLSWVDIKLDKIAVDYEDVQQKLACRMWAMHKPRGLVTARRDDRGRKTVFSLFPKEVALSGQPHQTGSSHEDTTDKSANASTIKRDDEDDDEHDDGAWRFPVGRLDADSEGLLLFCTDGPLADKLTHPGSGFSKVYRVWVRGRVTPDALARLSSGVTLDSKLTMPANFSLLRRGEQARPKKESRSANGGSGVVKAGGEGMDDGLDKTRKERRGGEEERGGMELARLRLKRCSVVEVTLHEGRHRQVRRMLGSEGLRVMRLLRVRFGPVQLGTLEPGRRLHPEFKYKKSHSWCKLYWQGCVRELDPSEVQDVQRGLRELCKGQNARMSRRNQIQASAVACQLLGDGGLFCQCLKVLRC